MNTILCDLLGIKYPLIQGGMAWVSDAVLAAAVSEAGGLGMIASGSATSDYVCEQVKKAFELTEKPFGVNIMLMNPETEKIAKNLCEMKVPVVTTGAGNPGKYMDVFKKAGIKVVPVVPSTALAIRMERMGADALIVEGHEAGGHIGEQTTMVLVPQVCDAVNIPVIAAGGIADGRGVAAAFMLGAVGVQMGTRFICSEECSASMEYKNMILKARDRSTVITGRTTGHPVRCIKNKLTKDMEKLEADGIDASELERIGAGALARAVSGDVEHGSVMAGQIAGMITEIRSCHDIMVEIVEQAKDVVTNTAHNIFNI